MYNDHTPRTNIAPLNLPAQMRSRHEEKFIGRRDAARAVILASALAGATVGFLCGLYMVKLEYDTRTQTRAAVERECLAVLADQAYSYYLQQMPQEERDGPPVVIQRPSVGPNDL